MTCDHCPASLFCLAGAGMVWRCHGCHTVFVTPQRPPPDHTTLLGILECTDTQLLATRGTVGRMPNDLTLSCPICDVVADRRLKEQGWYVDDEDGEGDDGYVIWKRYAPDL
jgi:hypothetical protein